VASLQFGDKPDCKAGLAWGRTLINYRGPRETYPYYSIADVGEPQSASPGTFRDKIVVGGRIGDWHRGTCATPPYGGHWTIPETGSGTPM